MKKNFVKYGVLPSFALSALSVAISAQAQDDESFKPVLEEVVVVGRLKSSAENIVIERLEQEVAVDFLSSEAIGRIGDSTVAAALRRVPGITLIDDKYVFVRGLGERYSSTLLNGAVVPSPDLSRSVIPLDIFPTSVVENLAVQKVHSADMPAAFGGGSVDIRTKSIPDGPLFSMELGTGYNSISNGDFLSYNGGSDDDWGNDDGTRALSGTIKRALDTYRGSFATSDILEEMQKTNPSANQADAEAVNRDLAAALNRDISIKEVSGDQDLSAEINVGNRFYFGDAEEFEFGFLAGYSYDNQWRSKESTSRAVNNAEEADVKRESTHNVSIAANLGLGARFTEDHSIETMSLYLRNTDDKTSVTDSYDEQRPFSERGDSFRYFNLRFEQREMLVNQISGEHNFGEATRDLLGLESLDYLDGAKFTWFYSDSESTTEIPNEVDVETKYFAVDGRVVVEPNNSAADYRFTDLDDEVESYGWEVKVPYSTTDWVFEVSGGGEYWQKVRSYKQLQFGLGSVEADAAIRTGALSDVFSDANILNPDNGYGIDIVGSNSESYLASNRVDAYYGKFDVTWAETLRVVAGLRYEEYQQVGLTWDPLDYTGSPILTTEDQGQDAIAQELLDAVFTDDDVFKSLALTWMLPGLWAEDFQIRAGYSETTVRPDLREISAASYIDPITDALVFGNPDVVPAQFKNYDLRAEWFFSNGDNLTVSLFYKDITDPIELFQAAGLDTTTAVEIINAESGEILGAEVEFMKDLGDVHDALMPFFLQGNLTILDTELVAGENADAPTNETRDMAGASKYVVNMILGYDSPNEMHAATLSYNVFGERLYFAGRLGEPDAYEQPFDSLDATYSFYPTDTLTVKLKVKNILDDNVEIQREVSGRSVTTFEEEVGRSFSASIQYRF